MATPTPTHRPPPTPRRRRPAFQFLTFTRNPSLPLPLRTIHNLQRALNLPAYPLALVISTGMIFAWSPVWLITLPYLLSAFSLAAINFVERDAARGAESWLRARGAGEGLTERKYLRLQAAKLGVSVLWYFPGVVAYFFSTRIALVVSLIRLHESWFWKVVIAMNVVHWVSVFVSLVYAVCFYRPVKEGTIRLDDGVGAAGRVVVDEETVGDEEFARALQAREPGWEQP